MSLPDDPRKIYVPDDPAEDERRGAKHRLVGEVKRLIELVALADVSDAALGELDALTAGVATIGDRVADLPSLRTKGGMAMAGLPDAALLERSGISGRANPLAPPLHLWGDGPVTRGWAVWTDAYEGPAGCLHGGFVAAAFDDLLGMAQLASGSAGYTGTLTVRMVRPTPLNERIDYEAGFDRVEGRKIFCWARSRLGEALLGEAEIVFVAPRNGTIPR